MEFLADIGVGAIVGYSEVGFFADRWGGNFRMRRDPGAIRGELFGILYSVLRKASRSCLSSNANFNPNSCPLIGPGSRWNPPDT